MPVARGARPEDRPWLARFLELAPARFSTAVLERPRLQPQHVEPASPHAGSHAEEVLVDGRRPLRFLNLPGFEPDRPHRLNAMASRARVSRSPVLHELCERYAERAARERLARHGSSRGGGPAPGRRARLRRVAAGDLPLGARARGAASRTLQREGTRAFIAWLEGPAPRGGGIGINRYVFHRVARERPDVLRTYPDLDGADGESTSPGVGLRARRARHPRSLHASAGRGKTPGEASEPARVTGARRPRPASRPPLPAHGGDGEEPLTVRLTGLPRSYARPRGGGPRLCAGAPRGRSSGEDGERAAAPPDAAGGAGRDLRPARLRDLVQEGRHSFEIVAVNAAELPDFVERLGEDYFEDRASGSGGGRRTASRRAGSGRSRWPTRSGCTRGSWPRTSARSHRCRYSRCRRRCRPGRACRADAPRGSPGLPVPVRLRLPEHGAAQESGRAGSRPSSCAFPPGEGPQLLIKTINAPLRPLAEEELALGPRTDARTYTSSIGSLSRRTSWAG